MATKSKSHRGAKVRDLNPRKDAKGGHRRGAHGAGGHNNPGTTLSTGNNPSLGRRIQ